MQLVENIRHYPMFVVGAFIFLAVGLFCTVWARRVQHYAISWHERHPALARFNLFRRRIHHPAYLWEVRLCGSLSLIAGAICCWALLVGR
jgi:hypothetical protein